MSNAEHHSSHRASTLHQWVTQTLRSRGIQVKLRFRGNTLHLLCQAEPCPDRFSTLLWLLPLLQQTDLNTLIPAGQTPLYQLQLYGSHNTIRPDWTASIYLNQLDRYLEQLQPLEPRQAVPAGASSSEASSSEASSTSSPAGELVPFQADSSLTLSNRSLAQQGQEVAIASYLSEALSDLGVGVRVSAKTVPYAPPSAVQSGVVPPSALSTKRLWIACEAAYSPDSLLVSEPITRRLRELEIAGYRDAVIVFQVAGETKHDWKLRVDLTPPTEMVKEWAHWGDVEAIRRFLNQRGESQCLQITTASLRESTLHLFCSTLSIPKPLIPDQAESRQWVAPLLELLAPQGIQAAALYGQIPSSKGTAEAPAWVEWLQLPAALHPALAESAIALAQQGDWEAIAFLLHRLLNASLEDYLRTGGIRLQLLPKQDFLHVMSEAVVCPEQRQVGVTIAKFLKQLKLSTLSGVRIYGRRAGQKLPLWSYGVDFVARDRLVPEATPEFAATDALVGDLISPDEQAVLRPDLTPADVQAVWQQWRRRAVYSLEQALTRSHLFTANPETQAIVATANLESGQERYQGGIKLAAVWGAAGVLLTFQANWLIGHVLQTQPVVSQAVTPPVADRPTDLAAPVLSSTLPDASELQASDVPANVSLPVSPQAKRNADQKPKEPQVFNSAGFTETDPQADRLPQSADESDTKPVKSSGNRRENSSKKSAPADAASPTTSVKLPYTPPHLNDTQITAEILAQSPPLPTFNSRQFDDKLKLYYRFLEEHGKPPDILILGSSRALRGIDPVALNQAIAKLGYTDATIFNFGINGATAQVADLVLQQVLPSDQLPRLIIWADGARAFNSGGTDVTYNGIIASEGYQQLAAGTFPIAHLATASAPPKPVANTLNITLTSSYESVDHWLSDQLAQLSGTYPERDRLKHSLQQGFAELVPLSAAPNPGSDQAVQPTATSVENAPSSTAPSGSSSNQPLVNPDGFLSLAVQFNPATYYQKYAKVTGQYDGDYENFRITGRQQAAARSLLQFTHAHNIPVVFVNLPLTEDYLDPFRHQQEQTFKDFMVDLSIHQPGLTFRDLGDLWTTQYGYFSDPSHLNRYGAYAVSKRLAQDPLIPWVSGKPKPPK